jgi:hypothetical protein
MRCLISTGASMQSQTKTLTLIQFPRRPVKARRPARKAQPGEKPGRIGLWREKRPIKHFAYKYYPDLGRNG